MILDVMDIYRQNWRFDWDSMIEIFPTYCLLKIVPKKKREPWEKVGLTA